MTASRVECKKGLANIYQPSLGILLDRNDLNQLDLLKRFGTADQFADPKRTICLPRHQVTDDLSQLLSSLEGAGRIKVKHQITGRSYTPQQSGNVVIRPGVEDATVLETFKDVELSALRPLLGFQEAHPNLLESAILFPNLSKKGLKGAVLQLDTRQKGWWRALAEYSWPFSRGLITVVLPTGAEEFIERSDAILPRVAAIGRANSGTIKYLRFFYIEGDERVFMAIAAGPSHSERRTISNELAKTHRPKRVSDLMESVAQTCSDRRQGLVTLITDGLGLNGPVEEVSNVPFVMLDVDRGQAVSGGVGPGSDLLPFTLSNGMIIHRDATDDIRPLGIKRQETSTPLPPFISDESVSRYIETLQQPMILHDLAQGYHPTMD